VIIPRYLGISSGFSEISMSKFRLFNFNLELGSNSFYVSSLLKKISITLIAVITGRVLNFRLSGDFLMFEIFKYFKIISKN
jgi:hypothetical protein